MLLMAIVPCMEKAMIEVLNLENIKIGSVNNKYGLSKKTKKFFLNKDYKAFKKLIMVYCRKVKVESPYHIVIIFDGYIDIDNPIKPILDGMEEAGVIINDRYIIQLTVKKNPLPRGKKNKLKIFIETMEDNNE